MSPGGGQAVVGSWLWFENVVGTVDVPSIPFLRDSLLPSDQGCRRGGRDGSDWDLKSVGHRIVGQRIFAYLAVVELVVAASAGLLPGGG